VPELTATQLVDVVAGTLRDLGRPHYEPLMTDIQEFTAFHNLLDETRVAEQTGGYGVQWNVAVNNTGTARNTGFGGQDNPKIVSTMVQAQADWRGISADYSFLGEEISMNADHEEQIVDLVAERRVATLYAVAELFEADFWGPPVSSTDTITPWGVNTWIAKAATEGFTGLMPAGFTTLGISATSYPRWRNYAGPYANVTPDDLIRRWRRASRKTNFKPPVSGIPQPGTAVQYGYYTNEPTINYLEELLVGQNESIGRDLARYDNDVVFHRTPVHWVPFLDRDTTGPLYGINWGKFKTKVLRGWWLRETNVPHYPGQHTMSAHFLDCRFQPVTYTRRCHFVLSTGTSYPS
jgi:hypothetical protein